MEGGEAGERDEGSQENLHWRFGLHLDFSAAAEPASGSVWMPASVEFRF